MRRAKLGDVYVIHVPNGYKIFQWAYQIPQLGKYIRVFDGLYDSVPNNVTEIVLGEHSYIIGFDVSKVYRIGLAQFVDNIPVPDMYPFPLYRLSFWKHELDDGFRIWIRPTRTNPAENVNAIYSFDVNSMKELPHEYQCIKLLDSMLSPAWLLYLFDYDFTLSNLNRFWPQYVLGENKDEILRGYQDRISRLIDTDRA